MSESLIGGVHTLLQRGSEDSSGADFETIACIEDIEHDGLEAIERKTTDFDQQDRYERTKSILFTAGRVIITLRFTYAEYRQMVEDFETQSIRSYRIVLSGPPQTIFNFQALVELIPTSISLKDFINCNVALLISKKWLSHGTEEETEEARPETIQYAYIVDSYGNVVYKFNLSGELQNSWDDLASNEDACLTGIAVGDNGNMYIEDGTVYSEGNEENTIRRFDSDGNFIASWGLYGDGDEECAEPWGIAIDSDEHIIIADTANNRIQIFTSAGTFVSAFGEYGNGEGQFDLPYDLAVDNDGNIYVANTDNHCIQKFSSSGIFQWESGSQGSDDGQFEFPYGIALDSNGNIYVADRYNYRIQKFNSSGVFQTKWGSYGTENGQFDEPSGIDIDSDDNIYVVDTYNIRVQVFDSDGNYLSQWTITDDPNAECQRICVK